MRRWIAVTLLLLLLCPAARAEQEEVFSWTLQKGAEGVSAPAAMAIAQDGGVFVVGVTDDEDFTFGESRGGEDGFVLRLDASGRMLWQGRWGGSGDDGFTHVLETGDGGCIVMGVTASTDGDAQAARGGKDVFLVRLNAQGETVWTKCLGGTLDDELLSLQAAGEDGYIVCGQTASRNGDLGANFGGYDAWAAYLSGEDGKPLWVIRHGLGGDDRFTHAVASEDGCLLLGEIAEETSAATAESEAVWTARPVAMFVSLEAGEALWQVSLGGAGNNCVEAVLPLESGWLLAGDTNAQSMMMPTGYGGQDAWVLQLRSSGAVAWQRVYGGSSDERSHALLAVPSSGYVLLAQTASSNGWTQGTHGGEDLWVVKMSGSGTLEWQQALGGSDDSDPAGIVRNAQGEYLVAGTSLSQDGDIGLHRSVRTGFLARLAPNGNLLHTLKIGDDQECTLLDFQSRDGAIYLLGSMRSIDGGLLREEVWIARLAEEGAQAD